ncbi:amidohydrolase [Marinobacterium arenosum]|uniref:amidohydrolase n=1 Tax=Marinobacterium arenosum TaxID=2862496 RepID=UPI001C94042D|nr:amidohydrolase [Marinobacterium arenosum]MBY4677739.1 amidohydrolase [Marinobacterium arenosum]
MRLMMSLLAGLLMATMASAADHREPADRVLLGGLIYTADGRDSRQQAVAIRDGKLVYVGSDVGAEAYIGVDTAVIELDGRMVMPGIHDSHVHALEGGSEVGGNCWLRPQTRIEDYRAELRRCAKRRLGTDWVLAYGHQLETLLAAEEDPVTLLDRMVSDRPVAIMEQSSHSAWVNSKALALAGIDRDTADPQGGIILRNEAGQPNGILLEVAAEQVFELAHRPNPEAAELNYRGLLETLDQVAANGITAFCDARVYWQRGWLEVWQRAERERQLNARVNLGLWAYPDLDDGLQLRTLKKLYRRDPNSLLQVNQIKIYSDGIIHNTSAALLAPYDKSLPQLPARGLNYFSQQRLQRYVAELGAAGFDFHIHAIGDRGVHESLNAIEQARSQGPQQGRRHRLTHVELIDDADLPRFAQLKVIADMQVAGAFTLPGNAHWQAPYIGQRAYRSYRLKDLHDAGAHVVLSSDWTVSPLSPFLGIQRALQRGAQSISLSQALRAYTINAAYLMQQEQVTGSLEVGKAADLIVLDRNLFETPVERISQTRVLLTLLAGEETWRADGF